MKKIITIEIRSDTNKNNNSTQVQYIEGDLSTL